MAQEYLTNLTIAGLTLAINPESYEQQFKYYGSYKRTIGGGIVNVDVNGRKLVVNIKGVTQTQTESLKKRCALRQAVAFRDYVPIAEITPTRTVVESLGNEEIEGQTVYLYVPEYQIVIFDFIPEYGDNIVSYTISGEEI